MGGSLAGDVHERLRTLVGAPSWGLWAHVGHKDGSLASVHLECLRALVGSTVASVGSSWRVLLGACGGSSWALSGLRRIWALAHALCWVRLWAHLGGVSLGACGVGGGRHCCRRSLHNCLRALVGALGGRLWVVAGVLHECLRALVGACGRLWAAVLRCCGRPQRSIWALTLLGFKPSFHGG